MFLENDPYRNPTVGGPSMDPLRTVGVPSMDPLRHHISPPGALTGSRLSPQDSELSDIDEFGRPCLPGVDPHFDPSTGISRR